jgi:hypothetical protein
MRRLVLVLLMLVLGDALAQDRDRYLIVSVAEPYLELHTGPGRGYPVFHIAERGEQVAVLTRRTDWYKVRAARDQEGWVHRSALEQTLLPDGERYAARGYTLGDLAGRRWEAGTLYGDFGGANVIAAFGSFGLTPNISLELWFSQVLGRFSNSDLINANVVHTMYPTARFTPYFTLGGGVIHTKPKATLVAADDRKDSTAHAGVGLRAYVARRFVFRAEFKSYVVFTSRDENEEVNEWKAGFSFFF